MKTRDLSTLLVSGAITLVLVAIAAALLVRFVGRHQRVSAELRTQTEQLERLQRRDPFPNESNVRQAEQKHRETQQAYVDLRRELARVPARPTPRESVQWGLLRDRLFSSLRDRARQVDAEIPADFAFGFERYQGGRLPQRTHLARLTQQLHYVDLLATILFDHRIRSLDRIDRHAFEDERLDEAAPGWEAESAIERRPRRRTPTRQDDAQAITMAPGHFAHPAGLYVRERMVVAFKAREAALWDLLDAIARMDAFAAIARIQVDNPAPPPAARPAAEDDARARGLPDRTHAHPGDTRFDADTARRGPLPREQRVMVGRDELLSVTLEIDFYNFGIPSPPQEATP